MLHFSSFIFVYPVNWKKDVCVCVTLLVSHMEFHVNNIYLGELFLIKMYSHGTNGFFLSIHYKNLPGKFSDPFSLSFSKLADCTSLLVHAVTFKWGSVCLQSTRSGRLWTFTLHHLKELFWYIAWQVVWRFLNIPCLFNLIFKIIDIFFKSMERLESTTSNTIYVFIYVGEVPQLDGRSSTFCLHSMLNSLTPRLDFFCDPLWNVRFLCSRSMLPKQPLRQ